MGMSSRSTTPDRVPVSPVPEGRGLVGLGRVGSSRTPPTAIRFLVMLVQARQVLGLVGHRPALATIGLPHP